MCDRTDLEVSEFNLTHSVEIISVQERNVENVFLLCSAFSLFKHPWQTITETIYLKKISVKE